MKCRTCDTDIRDDVKFCFNCGSAVSHMVVLCSGRPGLPCGAELQENFRFCQQCGKKVDHSIFQKKQTACKGIKEDGSVCGTLLDENKKFCMECGTPRPTVPFTSLEENVSFRSQQTIKTNNSSTVAATPGAGSAQVFGLDVEADRQSIETVHMEETFVSRFPVSSTAGSELVFGFSASLDGDVRKGENAGESPLPSHLIPQDSLVLGQLRVFKEDSEFDIENIQHSSISSSPDSVTIHENCLDNDDSEEDKDKFASSVQSASRNSSDVENKLKNVTLSEERGNDSEVVSDTGSGYDMGGDEGDDKFTDDSSPDSTDTEWDEDEVEKPTPPESVEAQNQKRTGPKRKKEQQHALMQEKKKKTENIKNRHHLESLEQLQETQQKTRMEVDEDKKHTWPVNLQHMQGSSLVDDHSAADLGSDLNSTSQMEKNESNTPIQRAQDLDTNNSCGVEEKESENKNEDQFEDINCKLDKVPIPETGTIQNLDMEEDTKGTVPKMDKPADENSNEKTEKTDKEKQDTQKDSEGSKLSKNEINKKSKDSKTKTSQNTSSKAGAASGTGTGTNTNQRKNSECIHVHFHALLSPEFDLTPMDVVLVKFEEDELGGWKSERHISKIVRKADDQYTEFMLDIAIPKKLIFKGKKILYKYAVLKDKNQVDKEPKHMWEHYHAHSHVNRTLDLPEKRKILAEWHQYDGIVFPEPGEGFINKLKKFFTGDDVHEREKRDLVHSIQYFLPKFFQDLNNGQLPQISADEALFQLEGLLLSLKRVYCIDRKAISVISDYERKITDILLAPVLRTFEGVPLCNWKENLEESERRMLQATTLVFAQQIFKMHLNQEEQELLARGLLVRPNHETLICHDLNCIDRFFPQEKKKQLSDSLRSFLESMASKAKSPFILFGIPLYHFLTGVLKPFDKMPEDFSHNNDIPTWWGSEGLNSIVNIVMQGGPFKWTMKLEQIVGMLHPLFEMDYLLPRTFMAMLNLDELVEVIKTGKISFEICAATIFYYVKVLRPRPTGYYISITNEEMVIRNAMYALGDVCRTVQIPDESSRSDVIQARMFYKISTDLLNATLGQVLQSLVAGAAQIFLHAVAVYDIMQRSGNPQKPNTRQNSEHLTTLSRLNEGVRNWHGTCFIYWITYFENYLKCWDSILAPVDIPSAAVKEAWNTEAEKHLNYILRSEMQRDTSGYLTNQLIHLYCAKVDTFHPNVQNCLSQIAFKAIETGYMYNIQFQQLGERERARFGTLLSDLFQSSWNAAMKRNDVEDRLILRHTLKWTPFSHFLKMFYGEERKMYLLSQNYILELTQAISVIDQRIHYLEDGAITFRDLDVIRESEDKFLELTMIMFEKSDKNKGKKINIAKALKVRQKEVDSYHTQKKYVKTLAFMCQGIHSVHCAELDSTIKKLDDEKNDLCIKDICVPANVETTAPDKFQPQITAFKLSDKVISMLEPLHESHNSNIFSELWRDTGHTSRAVTFDDVYEHIWKPVFSKLKDITQTIVTGEIQFVDMERYLGNIYKEDYDQMVQEMILINVPKGHGDERVKQLRQFRQLEACFHGAETILKVADAYKLGGDFEAIKTIASLENAADKKMKEFDDSLLTTCGFLEDLTSEKTNCLDHFITCEPLIQWLRKSMKGGLKELKVFVDLAMISAGEGDMEIDKVNCLHAATTGYASLIFDLDEDSGYEKLLEKCQILWKELKADPDLPKKLLDTNRHLQWLKMVKQAHGSIEVTSLAQAKAINSKGIICVGTLNTTNTARNTTMGLDLQNTLQLTVPDHEKESQGHRQYTFEQLQDLQSRLMLVAGRAEQGNDDVDRFMLVSDSVMRLANVFIKLNSAGCVLFKHWQAKFLCDRSRSICAFIEFGQGAKSLKEKQTKKDDVTTVIPKLANFMKTCLDEWIGHISQMRSKYFELNYFTTDQLVILQQELVKVGPKHDLDIRIFPLLSAVKENCTYEDLVDAMRKASDGMEMDEECKEMECTEEVEVASNEIKEEDRQAFIAEIIKSGFSDKLAKAALRHVKPDQITEGIIWCSDHLDEEETDREEDADRDDPTKEVISYEGWKKSDQSSMSLTASIVNKLVVEKGDMDVDPLIKDMEVVWEEFLASVSSSVSDYLSVEHLGLILRRLAEKEQRQIHRPFPLSFDTGTPNLIICPKADVLSTVLSIYMMDANQPLPQADEVLMCTPQTTLDELDVFWRRTVADTSSKIHCLVNGDLLDFEVSDRGERRLEQYIQESKNLDLQYRLVVICSAENEYKSQMITALDKFRQPPLPIPDVHYIADYVRKKLQEKEGSVAAAVDFDSSTVRVVKSWRAGVGKSLYVKRRNEELTQKNPHHKMTDLVNIPLQDKEINIFLVTQILLTHILPPGVTTPRIFHLDIAHEVQEGVDFFLFNLLILGCLTDKSGFVWRRSPRDLYLIETMPIVELIQAKKGSSAIHVHHVFDFLPFLTCRSPQECLDILISRPKPKDFKQEDPQFDLKEFTGDIFQRPYQYLSLLDQGRGVSDVDPSVPWGTPADCLKVLLRHCGVHDPSWAELHHFVWFLNTQLRDFEKSNFCRDTVAEDLPGFSKFVLRFLIQMSRDFSTRSLMMSEESPATMMEVSDDDEEDDTEDSDNEGEEGLVQYQMRRRWESSPHPYLFFNPDGHTITFLGFNIERQTGNLIDQQTRQVLVPAIMPQILYDSLVRNRVPIQENFDFLPRDKKIERLCLVMGNEMPHDPDDTYELTTDNVKKILAIYMRFRCDIPVIIMGETGCGKTRLVKFMCALQTPPGTDVKNMILMKVHGGTTTTDIKRKVEEARKIAQQNTVQYGPHMYTVLFFDEANTTEAIGMIKEIMCDRSMEGRSLDQCQNLKFVAACNPYKKHSEDLIKRLEQAGLGYHVDADKTTDRLGRVPMRRLVYRVQPLPQSLLPLVWDFGQLNTQIEDLYIRQMVRRYIRNDRLPNIPGLIEVISEVLTASQDFMRQQEDECSFVSLRDVERVLNVLSWLYAQSQEGRTLFNTMDEIKPFSTDNKGSMEEEAEEDEDSEEELEAVHEVQNEDHDDITRSLVLALGVCYHACLKNREEYRTHVAQFFRAPCNLPHGPDQIEQEISICQDVFLENVQLDKNIARNTALKENVFMMVTSIELRIPLFLVGKPGSSKSLAKTIVADAMQGNAAHKDLFKEFKQVQMVSFQCSPLSTPDGIVGTFRQCAQFQKDKDLDRFVSVVVLDEVGLAEDSPRMPLKTLHPLLEDGCQGDEEPQPHKKVAFIGISNWALDPAKMNRGILVQREVPDLEELINTAEGICGTRTHVNKCVKPFIEPLARSYLDLFKEASVKLREFFGLRDFYSLMKMIYSFVEQTNKPPTWYQLLHSIKRNFGGLDDIKPVDTFYKRLTMVDRDAERRDGDPDCTPAGLIKACLFDTNKTRSESRYLLLLTENYGALTILQQLIPTNNIITIFGSSFPSDQEYTQVCRNINRIKVCMETGNTVVLLNLENLYESLYDALNQYYVNFGGERYVDLGLGTHRVKCRVHKKFRLIVVAEKDVVYKKFPIPLINRLEKHFLTVNTILTREQSYLAEEFEKWVEDFSTETASSVYMPRNERNKSACSVGEVFIGYHADTCSSIILHVWQRLQALEQTPSHDTQKVLEEAKRLLLWCATPDSVVRLERCNLDPQEKIMLKQVYMKEQCHDSLFQYLHFMLKRERIQELFAQITTHSKLISTADKTDIHREVGIPPRNIAMETLQSFDTEQQFSRKIRSFMESNPEEELLLMIQSDSGDTSANLVASARYCVLDEHQQLKNRRTAPCHVIFIIQLPRIAGGCFTGFQCGLWHSAHIDDLRAQDEEMPSIIEMLGMSVGTLMERATNTADVEMEETFRANRFHHVSDTMETNEMDSLEIPGQVKTEGMEWDEKGLEKLSDDQHQDQAVYQDVIYQRVDHKLNVRSLILSCIQPALAMVKDKEETTDRSTRRIEFMLYLLHQNPIEDLPTFLNGLSCHIAILLKEKEKTAFRADNWLSSEAARLENINKTGTF
ncbi:hypothetical protein ACJMK2_027943, partial [Sinanodonta woodiana]